jgi:hypothetical protein
MKENGRIKMNSAKRKVISTQTRRERAGGQWEGNQHRLTFSTSGNQSQPQYIFPYESAI